jgi:hypothetical protein
VAIQRAFYRQLRFLESNLLYPSLGAKKYDEAMDLWQARVNRDWRFYFTIAGDTYRIEERHAAPKIRCCVRIPTLNAGTTRFRPTPPTPVQIILK